MQTEGEFNRTIRENQEGDDEFSSNQGGSKEDMDIQGADVVDFLLRGGKNQIDQKNQNQIVNKNYQSNFQTHQRQTIQKPKASLNSVKQMNLDLNFDKKKQAAQKEISDDNWTVRTQRAVEALMNGSQYDYNDSVINHQNVSREKKVYFSKERLPLLNYNQNQASKNQDNHKYNQISEGKRWELAETFAFSQKKNSLFILSKSRGRTAEKQKLNGSVDGKDSTPGQNVNDIVLTNKDCENLVDKQSRQKKIYKINGNNSLNTGSNMVTTRAEKKVGTSLFSQAFQTQQNNENYKKNSKFQIIQSPLIIKKKQSIQTQNTQFPQKMYFVENILQSPIIGQSTPNNLNQWTNNIQISSALLQSEEKYQKGEIQRKNPFDLQNIKHFELQQYENRALGGNGMHSNNQMIDQKQIGLQYYKQNRGDEHNIKIIGLPVKHMQIDLSQTQHMNVQLQQRLQNQGFTNSQALSVNTDHIQNANRSQVNFQNHSNLPNINQILGQQKNDTKTSLNSQQQINMLTSQEYAAYVSATVQLQDQYNIEQEFIDNRSSKTNQNIGKQRWQTPINSQSSEINRVQFNFSQKQSPFQQTLNDVKINVKFQNNANIRGEMNKTQVFDFMNAGNTARVMGSKFPSQYKTDGIYEGLESQNLPKATGTKHITIDANSEKALQIFHKSQNIKDATLQKQKRKSNFFKKLEENQRNSTFNSTMKDFGSPINGNQSSKYENQYQQFTDDTKTQDTQKIINIKENEILKQKQIILIRGKESQKSKIFPNITDQPINQTFQDERQKMQSQEILIREDTAETKKQNIMNKNGGLGPKGAGSFRRKAEKISTLNTSKGGEKISKKQLYQHEMATSRLAMNFQNFDINKELFEVQKFIENSEQMESGELSNDHYFNSKNLNQNIYNTGKTILQIHVNSHEKMGDFNQNIERITNEKEQQDSKLTLASKNYILQSKIFQQAAYNGKINQGRVSSTIADEMIHDKLKNFTKDFKNSQTDREFNKQKLHQESNSLSQQQTGRSDYYLNSKVATGVQANCLGITKQSDSDQIYNEKSKKFQNKSKSPKNKFEMSNAMPISFQNQKSESNNINSAKKIEIQLNKKKMLQRNQKKKDTGSGGSAASRKLQSPTGTQNSSFDNKKRNRNIFSKTFSNQIFSGDQKLKKKKFDFNKNYSPQPTNLITQGYNADQNFYLQIEKHPEMSIDYELQIQNKIQELKKLSKLKKLLIQQQLKNLKTKLETNEEHLIQNKKLQDVYFKLFGAKPQFEISQRVEQNQIISDIAEGNIQLEDNSEEARTIIAEEGHDYQDSQNQNYLEQRSLLLSQKTHASNHVGIDVDSKKTGDGSDTFKGNNMSGMNVTQIKDEHQSIISPTFMNASNIMPSQENLTTQKREIVNIIKIQPFEKIKEEISKEKFENKNNHLQQYQSSQKNSNIKSGQTPKFFVDHTWIQGLFSNNKNSLKNNQSHIILNEQLKKEHQLFTFYNQTIGNSLFKERMQTMKYVSQFQNQLNQDKEELTNLKIQNQKIQKIVQRYQKFIMNFQEEWNENFKHKILRNNSVGSAIYDQSPAQNIMKGAFEFQPQNKRRRSQLEFPISDDDLIPQQRLETEEGHQTSNIRVGNFDVPIQGFLSPKTGLEQNSTKINQPDNFQFQLERKSALSNPATEKTQAIEKIDTEKIAKFLHQIKNTCKIDKALDLVCSLIDITKPFLNCSKIMIVPIDPYFQQILVSKELNSKEKLQFVRPFEFMDNHIGLSRKLYGVSKNKQEMCSELILDSVAKQDQQDILIKANKVAIIVRSEKRKTPFMILQVEVPLETKSNIGGQKSRHQSVQKSKDSHMNKQIRKKSGSPDLREIQESRLQRSGSSNLQKLIRKQSARGSTKIQNKKKSQIKKSDVYIIHLLFQSVKLQIEKILYKQTIRYQKNAQDEVIELVQNFMNCSTLKGLMREMNRRVAPFFGFQNINVMFHDPEKLNLYTITFGDEEDQKQQFLFQLKNATSDRERENILNKEAINDFVLTSNNIIQYPTSTGITAIVFKNQKVRLINDFTPRSDFNFVNEIDNPKGIKVIENILIGAMKREDGSSNGIVQLYNSLQPITSYEKKRFSALSMFFGGCIEKMEDKTRKLTTVVSIQMNGQKSKLQSEQGYNWISEEGNYATFQKMSKSLNEAQQELRNQQQDLDDDFSDK